jgi:hypothetical protein
MRDWALRVAIVLAWSFAHHVIFDDEFNLISVLGALIALCFIEIVTPIVQVIICNIRKVPYHGKEGPARRSSSGS